MSAGSVIAEARARSGLSLRALADRAGTSAATLSNYESGVKEPRWSTVERIIDAAGLAPVVSLVERPRSTSSARVLAADLRDTPEAERIRVVLDFVDRWRELRPHERVPSLADAPDSTGSARWDALVAGLCEHLAYGIGTQSPGWTQGEEWFLDSFWWVVDRPVFHVWAVTDTPAALMRHGVLLSRHDLERA